MKSKAEFPMHQSCLTPPTSHSPPQDTLPFTPPPFPIIFIPNGVEMPLSRLPCSCRRHFPWYSNYTNLYFEWPCLCVSADYFCVCVPSVCVCVCAWLCKCIWNWPWRHSCWLKPKIQPQNAFIVLCSCCLLFVFYSFLGLLNFFFTAQSLFRFFPISIWI